MSTLLSFDNAPPFSVPARFFASAPAYGLLAGLLLIIEGGDLFLSRWSPAALALTHLLTVGVLMQVMIGALFQFLPVAADAGVARPRLAGGVVHPALNLGALLLGAGFYFSRPMLLAVAAFSLTLALAVFLAFALPGLLRKPHTSPSIPALKLALIGLSVTLAFGLYLLAVYAFGAAGQSGLLTAQHAAWGLIGWSATLVVGVAYVVVPMFQLTPAYPKTLGRRLVPGLFVLLLAWSAVQSLDSPLGVALVGSGLALTLGVFASRTLGLQAKSRRAEADTTVLFWRLAMFSTLLGTALWAAQSWLAVLTDLGGEASRLMAFGLGTLAIFGVLLSVISGMLYKILPFLCWLHLQQVGMSRGIYKTPHMGVFLGERPMRLQFFWHRATLGLLLLAIALPTVPWLASLAGLALLATFGLLGANLWSALRVLAREKEILLATAPLAPSAA